MEKFSEELNILKSNEFYFVAPLDKTEDRIFVKCRTYSCHKLIYFKSKIYMPDEAYCQIREYTAPLQTVINKAKKEIFVLNLLRNSANFIKCFGFNLTIHQNEETATYTLFSKIYRKPLIEIFHEPEFDKLRAMNMIHSSLLELNNKGIYYGALDPNEIFVDENNDIVLNNLFLADYWKQAKRFDVESSGFFLFNDNLIVPEIWINFNSMTSLSLMKTNLKALDVFSFGATFCFLFTGIKIDFSLLKKDFDPDSLLDFIVNLKATNNEITLGIHKLWEEYLFHYTSPLTPSLNLVMNQCLKIRRQERISMQELGEALKKLSEMEAKVSIAKMKTDQILYEVCNSIKDLDSYFEENDNFQKLLKDSVLMAENLLNTYKVEFSEANDVFLSSPCNESQQYNLSAAILYLIQSLCKEIIRGKCRKQIALEIIWKDYNQNYHNVLMSLYNKDVLAQDYAITGLTLINLKLGDAAYFFQDTGLVRRKTKRFFKFSDCRFIKDAFTKIVYHPRIIELLSEFNINIDTKLAISQIIERTYYYQIQPSLYGLTTYNGNIFITLFNVPKPKDLSIHAMAGSFIVLLHEIAHALRRFSCKNFREAKNVWTPPMSLAILMREEQGLTEFELNTLKGEAGFMFEEKLFGKLIKSLNTEAANYFLTADFDNLKKFRTKLQRLNVKNDEDEYTTLGRQKFYRLSEKRCGLSNISMFEIESDEEV